MYLFDLKIKNKTVYMKKNLQAQYLLKNWPQNHQKRSENTIIIILLYLCHIEFTCQRILGWPKVKYPWKYQFSKHWNIFLFSDSIEIYIFSCPKNSSKWCLDSYAKKLWPVGCGDIEISIFKREKLPLNCNLMTLECQKY